MAFFDNILTSIYKLFDRFVTILQKITHVEKIQQLEKLNEKVNSAALIISSILILIIGAIVCIKVLSGLRYSEPFPLWILAVVILGPVAMLFIGYLSNDFHNACSDLLDSNKTTLSNNAILKFGAIASLFVSATLFIFGIIIMFQGSLTMMFVLLLASLLLFINASTQFNPSLLNIEVTKKSNSGEDFIAIFSIHLKSMVYFERIISTILIVVGNVYLFSGVFSQSPYDSGLQSFLLGIGFLFFGIAYPVVVYILFIVFNFFNSILLAILSLSVRKDNEPG